MFRFKNSQKTNELKTVAVIFGGESCEAEVSVITGIMALNLVDKKEYFPMPVYYAKNGKFYTGDVLYDTDFYKEPNLNLLKEITFLYGGAYFTAGALKLYKKVAIVINCLHGGLGEDGSLAGYFNVAKIPFLSPPIFAQSVTFDKIKTKTFMQGIGVKTVDYLAVYSGENAVLSAKKCVQKLGLPLIIKPATLGSSIGIRVARDEEDVILALINAFKYSDGVLVEKFMENATEINCAVYKERGEIKTSPCEKPLSKNALLTFEDKYFSGEREFPAKIPNALANKIQLATKKVYDKLFAQGIIRIDYLVVNQTVYLNEVNSVPGSLSYYLLSDSLSDFKLLLKSLIEDTLTEFNKQNSFVKTFNSNILSSGFGKGCKKAAQNKAQDKSQNKAQDIGQNSGDGDAKSKDISSGESNVKGQS